MSSDEYFDFITDKEQWDVVIDIHKKLPFIKERLLNTFWEKVEENLSTIFSDSKWIVERKNDLFGKSSGLAVRHEHWRDIFKIGFGQLDGHVWVGVYCNDISGDSYYLLADQLRTKMPNSRRDSTAWPSWCFLAEDFNDVSSFKQILPARQELVAEEYAKKLQEIVGKTESILTEFVQRNS